MSPNHPQFYPSNLTSTHHVTVETGLILSIEFTAFDIKQVTGARGQCHSDCLLVTDGDGTVLLEKSCGWPGRLQLGDERVDLPVPPKMKSRSNTVNFIFRYFFVKFNEVAEIFVYLLETCNVIFRLFLN